MAYKLEIISIEKTYSPAQSDFFLQVDYKIMDDKKVVELRSRGFDLGISEKELTEALKKDVKLYEDERKQAEANKEIDEKNKNVVKLKKLEGKQI